LYRTIFRVLPHDRLRQAVWEMKHRTLVSYIRLACLSFGILLLFFGSATCQVKFGVFWQSNGGEITSRIHPDQYTQMKITHFVVGNAYANEITGKNDSTASSQIKILAAPPLKFLTVYDLRKHQSLLVKRLYQGLQPFMTRIHPEGYGIIQLSEIQSSKLAVQLKPILAQLRDSIRSPIYYIYSERFQDTRNQAAGLFDFSILQINEKTDLAAIPDLITSKTRGIYFDPLSSDYYNLRHLQSLFQTVRDDSIIVLYLNGKWLQNTLTNHSTFKSVITAYATESNAVFSNPPVGHPPVSPGYTIIVLIVIWLITAIHYGFEPNYRKSIIRYFGYHRFFVDDIQERVLRFSNSNVIVILIQALTGALFLITFFRFFISETGFQAITAHYPALDFLGGSDVQLFFIGFVAITIFNLVGSLWIFISSPDFQQYNQVLTLFLWPQHLNLLLLSLLVTFTTAYQSPFIIYFCGIFYVIVLLSSFLTASTDVYLYTQNKGIFLIKTVLPYLVLVIITLVWLIGYTGVTDVWILARSLR